MAEARARAFTYPGVEGGLSVGGTIFNDETGLQYENLHSEVKQDFSGEPGGKPWWNGPDEDIGFYIATADPEGTHQSAGGGVANVGFNQMEGFDFEEFWTWSSNVTGVEITQGSEYKIITVAHKWTNFPTGFTVTQKYLESTNNASCTFAGKTQAYYSPGEWQTEDYVYTDPWCT